MKNFDWNEFKKGTISVTFKTKEEEQNFLEECEKRNITWNVTKENATKNSYWDKNNIAYRYKNDGLVWLAILNENYTILWGDYMEDTYEHVTFKKDMLYYPNRVVELNNGKKYLALIGKPMKNILLDNNMKYIEFKNYDNNLKHLFNNDYTINKIYSCSDSFLPNQKVFSDDLKLIWERKEETKEMTLEEIEKELGYKVKIVNNK